MCDSTSHGVFKSLDHSHLVRSSWIPDNMSETDILRAGANVSFIDIPNVDGVTAGAVLLYIYNAALEKGGLGDYEIPFVLGITDVGTNGTSVQTTVTATISTIHGIALPSVDTWTDWLDQNQGYPQWLDPDHKVSSIEKFQELLKKGPVRVIPFGTSGRMNDQNG